MTQRERDWENETERDFRARKRDAEPREFKAYTTLCWNGATARKSETRKAEITQSTHSLAGASVALQRSRGVPRRSAALATQRTATARRGARRGSVCICVWAQCVSLALGALRTGSPTRERRCCVRAVILLWISRTGAPRQTVWKQSRRCVVRRCAASEWSVCLSPERILCCFRGWCERAFWDFECEDYFARGLADFWGLIELSLCFLSNAGIYVL